MFQLWLLFLYLWSFLLVWELQFLHSWIHCNFLVQFDWLCFGFLWHIIWCPEWYNYIFFWYFYYDKAKTFFRGFAVIDNLYITFYMSVVSKYCDAGEHMGFYPPSSCAVLTLMVVRWSVLPLCTLRVSRGIGENPLDNRWYFLDHYDELTRYLSSCLEI